VSSLRRKVEEEGTHTTREQLLETYNALLRVCGAGTQWKRALELFMQLRPAGLIPNAESYALTIDVWRRGGQWEAATQLWGEMRATGVEPNLACYTAVLEACRDGRRWRMAMDVLQQLRYSSDCGPTAQCYNTVVATVWSCVQPSQSLAVVRNAIADGLFARTRLLGAECDELEVGGMDAATAQARALVWVLELKQRAADEGASIPCALQLEADDVGAEGGAGEDGGEAIAARRRRAVEGLLRSLESPLRAVRSARFEAESVDAVREWVMGLNLSDMLLHRLPDDEEQLDELSKEAKGPEESDANRGVTAAPPSTHTSTLN
jgi:pentatricopeptide repeat protein